jgi:hypothetical protein
MVVVKLSRPTCGLKGDTTSDIDRQRIAGVKTLLALGFTWHEGRWVKPTALDAPLFPEADALHALLVDRAGQLMSCKIPPTKTNSLPSAKQSKLTSLSVGLRARSRAGRDERPRSFPSLK